MLVQSTGELLTQEIVQTRVARAARLAGVRLGGHFCGTRSVRIWQCAGRWRGRFKLLGHQDLTTTKRQMHLSPTATEEAIPPRCAESEYDMGQQACTGFDQDH